MFLKLHRLTKFGRINRFMEMNFCFNEKHKKSPFCVTSSKRAISLHLIRVEANMVPPINFKFNNSVCRRILFQTTCLKIGV